MKTLYFSYRTLLFFNFLSLIIVGCHSDKTDPEPSLTSTVNPGEGHFFTTIKINVNKKLSLTSTVTVGGISIPKSNFEVKDTLLKLELHSIQNSIFNPLNATETQIEVVSNGEKTINKFKILPFLAGKWKCVNGPTGKFSGLVVKVNQTDASEGIVETSPGGTSSLNIGDIEWKEVKVRSDARTYDVKYLSQRAFGITTYQTATIEIAGSDVIELIIQTGQHAGKHKFIRI